MQKYARDWRKHDCSRIYFPVPVGQSFLEVITCTIVGKVRATLAFYFLTHRKTQTSVLGELGGGVWALLRV